MKTRMAIFALHILSSYFSFSQTSLQDNIVGSNLYIESEILEEKRLVQIYLPSNYEESEEKYPVVYLLDGQLFFNHAISLSNKFRQSKLTPDFIIVGINTSYPQRFGHFSNGMDKFIEFMSEEMIPYIEVNYRTNNEKILFGWEYAGSLGFNNMLKNTIAFDGYLLASPFPIWDQIDNLDSLDSTNMMLYFSSIGPDEFSVYHGTHKLDSCLSRKNISGIDWSYSELLNEEHHSTGYPTLYHGLRKYFKYYPEFQEDSFQKFIEAGGLDYADEYAKERSRKYGFSPELSSWSKYTIIRSAIRADDYDHFREYSGQLVNEEFIHDLKYRALDIADYYKKNEDYQDAIEVYNVLQSIFPDSEDILNRIGNAYLGLEKTDASDEYFQRAKEVSNRKK